MSRSTFWVCSLAVVLTFSALAPAADDTPNPIVAQVKANLKDPDKPFTMLVRIKVKEGSEEKFEKAFAKARVQTRKEKGNRAYDLARDTKMPTQYVVYERWANIEALDEHIKSKYIQALLVELHDLTAGPPELSVFVPAAE
jgi:quinol monooxygenase YgiN